MKALFQAAICVLLGFTTVCGADGTNNTEYTFGRFYTEMWTHRGFSETDKQVCHDLVKVLNEVNAGPMICLIKFPKGSSFENVTWSDLPADKALVLERARLGRSKLGPACQEVSPEVLDKNLTKRINSGEIIYQSATVDSDNDGKPDTLLKRVWKEQYCNIEKEYGHPVAVHLMHECRDEHSRPFDVVNLTSQDAFKYRLFVNSCG